MSDTINIELSEMSKKLVTGFPVDSDRALKLGEAVNLNVFRDQIVVVLKKSHKHAGGDLSVGTSEILDDLMNVLCNLIGDKEFCEFLGVDNE